MAIKRRDMISIVVLLVAIGLLVLVILGMSGAVNLCKAGASGKRSSKSSKKKGKRGAKQQGAEGEGSAAGAVGSGGVDQAVGAAGAADLLSMDGPAALEAMKQLDPPAILYVLGQSSCPACQAAKKYLADNKHGSISVFVDIAQHPELLKNGAVPKPVVDSLGRGVPCMVAWHRKGKGKLGSKEGFSPKAVEELVLLVKQ
jgi:hypothetical protein